MIKFFQSTVSNNYIAISISKHIRGHLASFSEVTDKWQVNKDAAQLFGLRNNISLFCFKEGTSQSMKDAYSMGNVDFGLYDRASLNALANIQTTRQARPPTALSYQSGTDNNKLTYLDNLLGGRNSQSEGNPLPIQYENLTDIDLISRDSTIRFNYYSKMTRGSFNLGTEQEGIDKVNSYVNQTITNEGWYSDFMHWHWWLENYARDYFGLLGSLLANQDVYSGSYSDIAEYYFVRESVDTINSINGTINISYSIKYPNSPYDKITVPLWVDVDLNNTSFENKDITTSHGGKIRNKGNNKYVISINLDYDNTSTSFTISETQTPNYINLNEPVVTRSGSEIISDQPIKITLFSNLKSNTYELNSVIEERQLTLSDSFTLATTLDTANKNYFLGFINEKGISGTIEF